MILGSSVALAYRIIESNGKINSSLTIQDEANFLLRKIDWALTGVQTINTPSANSNGVTLSVTKINFSQNPIVFDLNSGNLRIKKAALNAIVLNSNATTVASISFQHFAASGTKPVVALGAIGLVCQSHVPGFFDP